MGSTEEVLERLDNLRIKLEDEGWYVKANTCSLAIDEIKRFQRREALFKREIAAADAIVTIAGREIVVPSIVKTEIDGLRAAISQ